jgi:hypothetical protein
MVFTNGHRENWNRSFLDSAVAAQLAALKARHSKTNKEWLCIILGICLKCSGCRFRSASAGEDAGAPCKLQNEEFTEFKDSFSYSGSTRVSNRSERWDVSRGSSPRLCSQTKRFSMQRYTNTRGASARIQARILRYISSRIGRK